MFVGNIRILWSIQKNGNHQLRDNRLNVTGPRALRGILSMLFTVEIVKNRILANAEKEKVAVANLKRGQANIREI